MRFTFGKNWRSYSQTAISNQRLTQARHDFKQLFDCVPLEGRRFLDIGFGQGLSLTIAYEMGALASGIDVDPDNSLALETTARRMGHEASPPTEIVSILDNDYVDAARAGGGFDIVHSWGVLHHTGDMNQAIKNAASIVSNGGHLVIAIYNRHWSSPLWTVIKRMYNYSPVIIRHLLAYLFFPILLLAKMTVTFENPMRMERGMDFFHNVVDWIGGYPYEYASCQEIKQMLAELGFECVKANPARVPTGCTEFVFKNIDTGKVNVA